MFLTSYNQKKDTNMNRINTTTPEDFVANLRQQIDGKLDIAIIGVDEVNKANTVAPTNLNDNNLKNDGKLQLK